jgi:methylenetetrahydrofolate dehydrogenase (NADP+)/methenyltetrahydrofolate cyclohydrolase
MSQPDTVSLDGRRLHAEVVGAYAAYRAAIEAQSRSIVIVRVGAREQDPEQWRLRCQASDVSARAKQAMFSRLGYDVRQVELPATVSVAEFRRHLADANADAQVSGVIVQLPVPARLARQVRSIDPAKDLDGLTARPGQGVCATADGMHRLLGPFLTADDQVAVFGGKGFVGSGVVRQLRAHGHDPLVVDLGDPPAAARDASVLITSVGRPHWLSVREVGDRPRKLIVDSGFTPNPASAGQPDQPIAFGDVHPSLYRRAQYATPVPGGVGPVEMAVLAERALTKDIGARVPRWSYGGVRLGAQFAVGSELVGADVLATRAHLAAPTTSRQGDRGAPPPAAGPRRPPRVRGSELER